MATWSSFSSLSSAAIAPEEMTIEKAKRDGQPESFVVSDLKRQAPFRQSSTQSVSGSSHLLVVVVFRLGTGAVSARIIVASVADRRKAWWEQQWSTLDYCHIWSSNSCLFSNLSQTSNLFNFALGICPDIFSCAI